MLSIFNEENWKTLTIRIPKETMESLEVIGRESATPVHDLVVSSIDKMIIDAHPKKLKMCYHHDPGHGWYSVNVKWLHKLGLTEKITCWSYQRGSTVYLEEDSDAEKFFTAYFMHLGYTESEIELNWQKLKQRYFDIKGSYRERSPVRGYASYKSLQTFLAERKR